MLRKKRAVRASSEAGRPPKTLNKGGSAWRTWECHEDVAVFCRHHLEPGLPRHDVVAGLQETLPKQLV